LARSNESRTWAEAYKEAGNQGRPHSDPFLPRQREEADNALLAVFQITNKGLAHVTEDLTENPEHGSLIEIASRGVPSLMVSYLYTPLGLPEPDYKLTHRPRND